jgi:hypothetical protein
MLPAMLIPWQPVVVVCLIVAALFVVLLLLEMWFPRVGRPEYAYRLKEYLITQPERDCFDILKQILGPEYLVFPQIHLDALMRPTSNGRDGIYAWRHINQKSVDFVVCDLQLRPLLAIELDDWSHERADRVDRDRIVETIFRDVHLPLKRLVRPDLLDVNGLSRKIRLELTQERKQ